MPIYWSAHESILWSVHLPSYRDIRLSAVRWTRQILPAWVWVMAYLLCVYTSLPWVPGWAKSIDRFWQSAHIGTLMPAWVRSVYYSLASAHIGMVSGGVLVLTVVVVGVIFIRCSFRRGLVALLPLGIVALAAVSLKNPMEVLHIPEYALLGVLIYHAADAPSGRGMAWAFVGVFAASCLDESIQFFLPNRYGDPKDVLMDVLGGGSGLWLAWLMAKKTS